VKIDEITRTTKPKDNGEVVIDDGSDEEEEVIGPDGTVIRRKKKKGKKKLVKGANGEMIEVDEEEEAKGGKRK